MIPPVFSVVAASSACTDLLGVSPIRFFNFGEAVQNAAKPYAVWQMITGIPANYLGQLPDMDDARVQIDVYASEQSVARELAVAVRDAIEPHAHMLNLSDRGRDATTRNYGYLLEFEFFTPRI